MRAFWDVVEKMDALTFKTLDKVEAALKKPTYRQRTEKALAHVRAPQRAIQFDA
jgi:hypothetical protein